MPIQLNAWQQRKTPDEVIELINHLLDTHTYAQVADILNTRGHTTGDGHSWTGERVARHCHIYNITSHYQRLRDTGMLTLEETAQQLAAHPVSIKRWHRLGLITAEQADDRGVFLYHPGQARPTRSQVEEAGRHLGETHRLGHRNPHRLSGRPRNVSRARNNDSSKTA